MRQSPSQSFRDCSVVEIDPCISARIIMFTGKVEIEMQFSLERVVYEDRKAIMPLWGPPAGEAK